jgi:hypothetical protein
VRDGDRKDERRVASEPAAPAVVGRHERPLPHADEKRRGDRPRDEADELPDRRDEPREWLFARDERRVYRAGSDDGARSAWTQ